MDRYFHHTCEAGKCRRSADTAWNKIEWLRHNTDVKELKVELTEWSKELMEKSVKELM